ncbi:hypothetical protein KGQ72_00800 [Patescibacteria group bacterium]|nr:hypothetical protein [Patescibacteria group bacterium]
MPLVILKYNPNLRVGAVFLSELTNKLTEAVSGALDVPEREDARLTKGDIEVWVQESGSHDISTRDLEIVVWAHQYPERLANLEERKEQILRELRTFLAENGDLAEHKTTPSGFVWVLLQPTAFGTF